LPPTVYIRPFKETDIETVWALVQRTIGISYRPDYSPEAIRFFQEYHPREKILDDAANGRIIVAEQNQTIVGTGTLREAHIRRVFIEPSHQGQGIGSLIADELESRAIAKGWTTIDLSSALGSLRFWESRGFSVSEEHFRPVDNNLIIHYYTMTKDLPNVFG
jgi:ribosomal protein S18 acetylase RimI-like enzyme